ncbi:MAG TPA: division/cell wall cluster transcriptional repressor MraZ [Candidatus Solibacter sp.]|jgi:MraZ protein|nr:division/cell wall cluster transcriptional repressor MraZ [Candidatus Solibacter sp.]
MFLGKHSRSLDAKGRLALPAKFREQLPGGSVVTISPENCLRVYPPAEWDRVTEQYRVSAATEATERNLIRRLFSEAHEIEFDGQGRALIPAGLRQTAGIEGNAMVVGVNNVVEIWSEGRWQALEAATDNFTELTDEVVRHRNASS